MPLILEERRPTPAKPAKKSIFKGITIAVLLHLIVVVAYLYATGNIGRRIEPKTPEVSSVSFEPKSSVVAAMPQPVVLKTSDDTYVHGGSDTNGVKEAMISASPPEALAVEKKAEVKPAKQENPSPVHDPIEAKPITAAKSAKPEILPATASAPKIPEAWVEREKARLEKDLAYHENLYWRREKAVISLEEKEDLLRPINEIKDKLQRLQESPEQYFGLMKR